MERDGGSVGAKDERISGSCMFKALYSEDSARQQALGLRGLSAVNLNTSERRSARSEVANGGVLLLLDAARTYYTRCLGRAL